MGNEQSLPQALPSAPELVLPRTSSTFLINGKLYRVGGDDLKITPHTRLVEYIRDVAHLKGTKISCLEGGCGACMVSVKSRDVITGKEITRSVNSCLVPVYACDGWEISTVEGVGCTQRGLHPIQQRMVNMNASQCGFCSPGWVMSMYSLMESKKTLYTKDIEDCLDGNICRCTGYRPIMDAMKSFGVDAPESLKRTSEEESKWCVQNLCPKLDGNDNDLNDFEIALPIPMKLMMKSGQHWVKVINLRTLFMAIEDSRSGGKLFKVVAGNTGWAVNKAEEHYDVYIDLTAVYALNKSEITESGIVFGGAITISAAIQSLLAASTMKGFEYCKILADYWKRMANMSVRNLATLAGNLMLKHKDRSFSSDVFTPLETIRAELTIATSYTIQSRFNLIDFLDTDMVGRIIYSIHLPRHDNVHFKLYRVSRRVQNSSAYANAGFLFPCDPGNPMKITGKPSIVYGGISKDMIHALRTEPALENLTFGPDFLKTALQTLSEEVQPDTRMVSGSSEYRKSLTLSLFYKFTLFVMRDQVPDAYRSGGMDMDREVSSSKQSYHSDVATWPVNQAIKKLEAPLQVSGEAEYTNDIPEIPGELYAEHVLSTMANCQLDVVDTSEAMKIPGFVAWIDHTNIPGVNDFLWGFEPLRTEKSVEVVFVKEKVSYAGQLIGLIIGETKEIARAAVKLVKISYKDTRKPILDIPSALEGRKRSGLSEESLFNIIRSTRPRVDGARTAPTEKTLESVHSISGILNVGSQIHFQIESQTCLCVPKDGGMEVFAATQCPDNTNEALSKVLGIPSHKITTHVRRLGGGFGGKLVKSQINTTSCGVAAYVLNRPVRAVMDHENHLRAIGKRLPYHFKYKVDFDDTGKITNLEAQVLCNPGWTTNEPTQILAVISFQSAYAANNWEVKGGSVMTNNASNTFCRNPGAPASLACIETIMENIAQYLKKDPWEVRQVNLTKPGQDLDLNTGQTVDEENYIPRMYEELKVSADLENRQAFIANFNMNNRWRKRALAILPTRHGCHFMFSGFNLFMVVHTHDGSISLGHSGVEMGQGINTKIVQVVAYELGVPIEKIQIKPVSSFNAANMNFTGTGIYSEMLCHAASKASINLRERMDPIRKELGGNPTWEELVHACRYKWIDMSAYYNTTYDDGFKDYNCWSLSATEVQVDLLTGEYKLIRMDHLNDTGTSLSPDIDMGQIEGAIMMGIGMFTTEKLIYDQDTGQLLTNRAWTYKPPMPQEVPRDFRVTLLKNAPFPRGVYKSKSTGEAGFLAGLGAFLAIRNAIRAARVQAGNTDLFIMDSPVTVEDISRLSLAGPEQFVLS